MNNPEDVKAIVNHAVKNANRLRAVLRGMDLGEFGKDDTVWLVTFLQQAVGLAKMTNQSRDEIHTWVDGLWDLVDTVISH